MNNENEKQETTGMAHEPVLGDVDVLRERLARLSHERWCRWIDYMFDRCNHAFSPHTGSVEYIIPRELNSRWTKQMLTQYDDLSEPEKNSDRLEADEIIKLLKEHFA